MLVHSGTINMFYQPYSTLPLWKKAIKLFYTALYWLVLITS